MSPRWKLTVEGLGKIDQASIDVRPLTLLVGQNNSGKSYLASLIWGLVAMQSELTLPPGPARERCEAWIAQRIDGQAAGRTELGPDELEMFARLFDAALEAHGPALVQRIFNNKEVRVRRVAFENVAPERTAALQWESPKPGQHVFELLDGTGRGRRSLKTHLRTDDAGQVQATLLNLLVRRTVFGNMCPLVEPFDDTFQEGDPIYLPASRTGFMQLYRAAARRSVQRSFRFQSPFEEEPERSELRELTTPAFHFIDMLSGGLPEREAKRFAEEAEILERALGGQIERVSGPGLHEFRYRPAGASLVLPMPLASSLVTELAPIVLVLRHLGSTPLLILEEPEAHLHPELQRTLARVVVRLVRKGLHVLITTHSENFCQQINNFVKLGALDEGRRAAALARLGYDDGDPMALDDLAGYQLDVREDRSAVRELKKTEYGLAMPLFNKTLLALGDEVEFLDGELGESRR